MAIFRAETKSISRGKGHNLVAALSYRAGIALTDTNELNPEATTHDYTRKTDVVHTEILLPKDLDRQLDQNGITLDFQSIADLVEKGETTQRGKMKNSARLAREWVLCGVPELSRAENVQLFQQFAREQAEEQGVISMCFVHDPRAGNDTRSKSGAADATAKDERNIHAHIVLLTRKVQLTKDNTLKLGAKSDSELSNDERTNGKICPKTGKILVKGKGLVSNRQWIRDVRESWADMLNEKLLEKNVQPVTHKSYSELGLDIVPTLHVGNDDLSQSKRLNNERIKKRNESVIKSTADSFITKSNKRIDEAVRRIDRTKQCIGDTESGLEWTAKQCENLPKQGNETKQRIEQSKRKINIADKWVVSVTQRARRTQSIVRKVDQGIAEREKPAPRLFDNDYQRAFFERKGRIDRAIRKTDRELEGAKFRDVQRSNDVKNAAQTLAYRLLNRRREGLFDKRQLTVLDDFARKLEINENQNSDFKKNVKLATDKINTVEVLENNSHVFRLLNFPLQEREHHQTVTADFYRFIAHVDKERVELRQKHQSKLGRNDTSRVTAEILTVKPYLVALTNYANNSEKTDESRALAEQHINKTIRLTCRQYEIACKGLNTLSSTASVQKHVRELEDCLSTFTADYSGKLTVDDLRSIDEGLQVIDSGIEIGNKNQSRNDLSPSF